MYQFFKAGYFFFEIWSANTEICPDMFALKHAYMIEYLNSILFRVFEGVYIYLFVEWINFKLNNTVAFFILEKNIGFLFRLSTMKVQILAYELLSFMQQCIIKYMAYSLYDT